MLGQMGIHTKESPDRVAVSFEVVRTGLQDNMAFYTLDFTLNKMESL